MNPDDMPEIEKSHLIMDEFVHQLVAERRAGHRPSDEPDLLDTLLSVAGDDGLTDRELHDLLIFSVCRRLRYVQECHDINHARSAGSS